MTVSNENSSSQHILSVPDQTLPTDFYFLEKEDLLVISDLQGELTLGALIAGYTVILPPAPGQQGDVVMIGGIATEVITIFNDPDCTQLIDYVENDDFPAELHERGLDKLTMLICRLIGDFRTRAIQYPLTELNTSPFLPPLEDREAGGAGTLYGFKGVGGAPEPISKGVLDTLLTLSNAVDLGGGSPSPVNGATQRAIKLYVDAVDAALQAEIDAIEAGTGLDANGDFIPYAGARFLDGFDAILAATTQKEADEILDAVLRTIVDIDLPALNGRLADLEGSKTKISQGSLTGTTATITLTKATAQSWDMITATVQWQLSASGTLRYDSVSVTGGVASEVTNFLKANTYNMQLVDDPTGEDLPTPLHILKFIPTNTTVNTLVITINYTLTGKQTLHSAYAEGTTI